MIGSPGALRDLDEVRELVAASYDRDHDPAGARPPAGGDHRRGQPLAGTAQDHRADAGDPRNGRSARVALRRPRDGTGDPRRAPVAGRGDGPRPAAGPLGHVDRRDRPTRSGQRAVRAARPIPAGRPHPSIGPAGKGSPRAPRRTPRAGGCRSAAPTESGLWHSRTRTASPGCARASGGRGERASAGRASVRAASAPCAARGTLRASSPWPLRALSETRHPTRPQNHRPAPPLALSLVGPRTYKSGLTQNVKLNRPSDMAETPGLCELLPTRHEPATCGLKDRQRLPPRARRLVVEWAGQPQDELNENRARARAYDRLLAHR